MEVGDKERRARLGWFVLDGGRQGQLGFHARRLDWRRRKAGVGEGDVPGEAAGMGETGRRRKGGAGDRQELGETGHHGLRAGACSPALLGLSIDAVETSSA